MVEEKDSWGLLKAYAEKRDGDEVSVPAENCETSGVILCQTSHLLDPDIKID